MTTDQIKYRLEAPYKTEMAMKEKSYSKGTYNILSTVGSSSSLDQKKVARMAKAPVTSFSISQKT